MKWSEWSLTNLESYVPTYGLNGGPGWTNAWERGRLARRVEVNPKYEDSAFGQMDWNRKKNNWLRACVVFGALAWLLGCAYGSEQVARAPAAVETEVANEVGEDTNSSTFQAAEERGGEWWLEYSAYDLRRTREVVQEAYKRPHPPVHEDINVWVYTQDFADRFGMPQRWVDPELQGAEALAYRLELHLERTCSSSDSGNWDICREVKDYCYLDIYVRSDAPIPWNTDLQIWHRYKLRHSVNMLQHSYGPASGFLSEQAQRDYQYGYSRRGLYVNKHGIDYVTWAANFSWWGGEPSRRGGLYIYSNAKCLKA